MKILLILLYFEPDISANSAIFTPLVRNWVEKGHEVTVVTAFPHYDINRIWDAYRGKLVQKEQQAGCTIYRSYIYVPKKKSNILGRLFNYVSFNLFSTLLGFFAGKHDVIFTPSPPLTIGLSAYILSRLRKTPYIYNVQDIYPDVAIRLGLLTNTRLIAFFKALESFIYDKAKAISVLSDGFRNNLLNKHVPADKIHIIPNFANTGFIKPLPKINSFSQKENLTGKFVVLFAGNVGHSQGLEHVLESAHQLSANRDIRFLIVGNGVAKPGLEQRAAELNMTNVTFLPFQPQESVPELYASADICLVPLRKGIALESVPSKVYSIMAAGKPIVASVDENSDTWRFIQSANCGIVCPPELPDNLADAILHLYHHPEEASAMGRNGRELMEHEYTPAVIADKYLALFQRVTSKENDIRS